MLVFSCKYCCFQLAIFNAFLSSVLSSCRCNKQKYKSPSFGLLATLPHFVRTLCFIPPFRDLFSFVIYNRLQAGCYRTQYQLSKINSCIGTGCFQSRNPYRECPEGFAARHGYRGSSRPKAFHGQPIQIDQDKRKPRLSRTIFSESVDY